MTEIEKLRADMDLLIARSWAQETLLLYLAQETGSNDFGSIAELESYSEVLKNHLRYSPLTDTQLALFDGAMKGLLERLYRLGVKAPPLDEQPPP